MKDDLERMGRQAPQEKGYAIRYLDSVNSRMTEIILTQTTVCWTVACEQASGEDGKIQLGRNRRIRRTKQSRRENSGSSGAWSNALSTVG